MLRADETEPDDLLPEGLTVALESSVWLVATADDTVEQVAVDRLEQATVETVEGNEAAGGDGGAGPSCRALPLPFLILFLKRPKQPIP